MKLDVVVGAQFGSEAKGHVTQRLIERFIEDWRRYNSKGQVRSPRVLNIRVAGPNAGHTAHDVDGQAVAFRHLPVGALIPGVHCAIAAGSEIDPAVLSAEIEIAQKRSIDGPLRLYVDRSATVLTPDHIHSEQGMHERTGSTGKGIGAARADRIMRTATIVRDSDYVKGIVEGKGCDVGDVSVLSSNGYWDYIIIEGTQGYGLGLHTKFYPLTTSSDCRAIDFLAMAGISPWRMLQDLDGVDLIDLSVWAVARVYPIRVAGPSGPLVNETTWEALGLPEERTTVTKKVRRVGGWDPHLVAGAVEANGGAPTVKIALTMLDQKFPDLANVSETHIVAGHGGAMAWLNQVEEDSGASVRMVTTGPNSGVFI
jgi:adenylosuccinate synthase